MRINHWNNVPGDIGREVIIEPDGRVYDIIDDVYLPFRIQCAPAGDGEIVIHFRSSGYDEPMTRDYPGGRSEDRELESVEFCYDCTCGKHNREFVDAATARLLFDHYREAIDAEELCVTE